jgi:hypothetical protein
MVSQDRLGQVTDRSMSALEGFALMIALGSPIIAGSALWKAATLGSAPAFWTGFLPAWVLAGIGVGLVMPNLVAAATTTLRRPRRPPAAGW